MLSVDNAKTIWSDAKEVIKKRIGEKNLRGWFSCVNAKSVKNQTIVLEVPNEFFQDWLINNYLELIQESLEDVTDKPIKVDIVINPQLEQAPAKEDSKNTLLAQLQDNLKNQNADRAASAPANRTAVALNPKYTFEAFVIGPSNRFAHAASLAVAESPAKAYNPLFIYGGVGLGKTHLMQAIGHFVTSKNPDAKLRYISSERFVNELIEAIQRRSTPKFRQKYRTVDVLLIDDIQFIANKEATQEEFFHTFNTLYDAHKQIVVSSDRPPKEIPALEQRLVSRFEWGLVTDIQPPDLETRIAILRKKLESENTTVPDDIVNFIASNIKSNIRELEGALKRVIAYAHLERKSITLELAKDVLKDMVKEAHKNINIDFIQKVVAEHFNIKLHELKTRRRSKNIVFPRQIAMYLAREMTKFSLPELGDYFGGKDHTTILHACNKIREEMSLKEEIKKEVEVIVQKIKA